jgi:diguanylate cyclase
MASSRSTILTGTRLDALLIAVGSRLQQSAPQNAVVARLGGDEFAILLAESALEGGEAMVVANSILADLQKPFGITGREIWINASIGIAIGPQSGRRAEDLTDAADRAMYVAKRAGRGTVRIFEAQRPPEKPRAWLAEVEQRRV